MVVSTSTNLFAFRADGGRNSLQFCIEGCAKAGYQVLDINFCEAMNPHSRMRGDGWEDFVRDIARWGRDCGVVFRQSHLPYYDIFGEGDRGKIQLMETLIQRSIVASGMLGVRWAVTHPGTVWEAGHNRDASLQGNLDYYRPHLQTAREAGVGIALENDFEYRGGAPEQRIYCASVQELVELCDAFGDDFIGICYDFGHANLTGGRHRQNLNHIGKRLKAVHIQDNHGQQDDHLLPFFGRIDWRESMAGLADIGFQGDLTFECQEFSRWLPDHMKGLAGELSLKIGEELLCLYREAAEVKKGEDLP